MNQPPSSTQPLVYIVMPNKNGAAHLRYSLESLFNTCYSNYRVLIVDNRSTDDSLQYASTHYPKAEVLVNEQDRGFAGSVNRGILHALSQGAEYVAIYSNDIRVKASWLEFSMEVFAADPAAGVVGFVEIPKENEESFFGSSGPFSKGSPAAALPGCLLLCSSSVFLKAGLMDEGYFMYGEDNDFFARISAAGLLLVQTGMPVWHYGEGSAAKKRMFPVWMAYRNAVRCSLKNHGFLGASKMVAALFYHGCIPRLSSEITDPSLKRLRRYNFLLNSAFLIGSLGWNAFHIFSTLSARVRTGAKEASEAVQRASKGGGAD